MSKLTRTIDAINEWLGRIIAVLILPSISIALYEVVMRYVFDSPTIWVSESIQILFGFYFLLGGSYTLLHRGHVRVDLLLQGFSARGKRLANIFGMLVAIFYLSVLCWITGIQAADSIAYLERAESVWEPYIFPVISAAPVAAALMILQAIAEIVREVTGASAPGDEADSPTATDAAA